MTAFVPTSADPLTACARDSILQDLFFFAKADWLPAPADFKRQTVQGKRYDLREPAGHGARSLAAGARAHANGARAHGVRGLASGGPPGPAGAPGTAASGAGSLSGAAHTRPVTKEGPHRVDNRLLLRSDIHAVFDQGYVTVTPEYRFLVSRRLKAGFDNGEPQGGA